MKTRGPGGQDNSAVLAQVVYELESKTQRKMRPKGLRKGKGKGPEDKASADRWVSFNKA